MLQRLRARLPKTIVMIVLAAVFIVGITSAVRFFTKSPDHDIVTAPVVRGAVDEAILATGKLEPTGMVHVGAQVSGRVEKLYVHVGQTVKAGEIIAEIDPTSQKNALRIAETSLQVLNAQTRAEQARLHQAQTAFRRQSEMLERDATSRIDYEGAQAAQLSAQANVDALQAQMKRAQVEIDNARVALAYTRIVAPSDGTVISIVTKQGQTLNSVQSVPTIVLLGRMDTMEAKVRISEADVARVRAGQPVWFTIPGDPQTRYHAKLREIGLAPGSFGTEEKPAPSSAGAAVYYDGLFRIANPAGRLRPMMTVQVHIVLGAAADVLIIPWSALTDRQPDGRYRVNVRTREGDIEQRVISVGLTDKIKAQVLSGLAEGDEVVIAQEAAQGQEAEALP